jgi:tRNA threonylcarbamoyladenosine biosynthesis protein TsaB
MGPGSYTGLRVGLSTAKGLCVALNKPLIGISTLEALSYSITPGVVPAFTRIAAMVDAGRNEVYHGIYDKDHQLVSGISPLILKEDSLMYLLDLGHNVVVVGDGASKAKDILSPHSQLHYGQEDMVASLLRIPAFKKLVEGNFENIAYSVPYYIKAPQYNKYV